MTTALRVSSVLCLTRRALQYVYFGLGLIGIVSVCFAVGQKFGYYPWFTAYRSTGLFYSPIVQGGLLGLSIVALARLRMWELTPILFLGLYLNPNRGGWVVAGIGLLATWVRQPLVILAVILFGALLISWNPGSSDVERFLIWQAGLVNLSWFGHGWGSFEQVWIIRDGLGWQPIHAHNDYLELAFEFGLYSVPVFCVLAYALSNIKSPDWPILVAFCTMALFAMPTFIPVTAVIGAAALTSTLTRSPTWLDGAYVTRTT